MGDAQVAYGPQKRVSMGFTRPKIKSIAVKTGKF